MADTSKAPERQDMPDCIYLAPGMIRQAGGYPAALTTPDNPTAVKFVRADLYDATQTDIDAMTAALAEAETRGAEKMREAALRAYDSGLEWDTFGSFIDHLRALPLPPRERDGQEGAA